MAKDANTRRTKKLPAYECIESQKNKKTSMAAAAAEPTEKEEK